MVQVSVKINYSSHLKLELNWNVSVSFITGDVFSVGDLVSIRAFPHERENRARLRSGIGIPDKS